jgi:hypothetical protein
VSKLPLTGPAVEDHVVELEVSGGLVGREQARRLAGRGVQLDVGVAHRGLREPAFVLDAIRVVPLEGVDLDVRPVDDRLGAVGAPPANTLVRPDLGVGQRRHAHAERPVQDHARDVDGRVVALDAVERFIARHVDVVGNWSHRAEDRVVPLHGGDLFGGRGERKRERDGGEQSSPTA